MARIISSSGYWMITPPPGYTGKTYIDGRYVLEHRMIAEALLGRSLCPGEAVHHKNLDKLDNSWENLEVLTATAHAQLHNPRKEDPNTECSYCGRRFHAKPSKLRRGRPLFCRRSCIGSFNFYGRKYNIDGVQPLVAATDC